MKTSAYLRRVKEYQAVNGALSLGKQQTVIYFLSSIALADRLAELARAWSIPRDLLVSRLVTEAIIDQITDGDALIHKLRALQAEHAGASEGLRSPARGEVIAAHIANEARY